MIKGIVNNILPIIVGLLITLMILYFVLFVPWHKHHDTGEIHYHSNNSKLHSHIIFL